MKWMSKISVADLITLGNGFLGTLAITYILDGRHVTASMLIFGAVILDGLDGAAARRFKSPHEIGRFLDSISDAVSFCLAPGLLIYNNFYDKALGTAWLSLPNAAAVIGCMFFVVFGLLRLARFAGRDFRSRRFVGLPTPAAAMIAVLLCLLWGLPELNPLGIGYEPYPIIGAVITLAFFMVSDLPYPKPMGGMMLFVGGTLVAGIGTMAIYLLDTSFTFPYTEILILILILMNIYLFGGPLYERKRALQAKARCEKSPGQKA